MKNSGKLTVAAFSLFLIACGARPANKLTSKNPVLDPKDSRGCPAALPHNLHRITVAFSNRAVPAKLALKLDGEAEPRVSECAALSQSGVIASLARAAGNQLIITVDHNGFYKNGDYQMLPSGAGFELIDLQNCGATTTSFYKTAQPAPLNWKIEFPNGPACAGRALAEYRFDVNLGELGY